MPRPYQLGQRQVTIDESRTRMVAAAKAVLATSGRLTVDDVAREADVARATVYYQFGSKRGLLEALFDSLAATGGLADLPAAFQQPRALDALDAFIAAFTKFWTADRDVMRRLRGLAAIDAELGKVLDDRNNLRRQGLRVLVERLVAERGGPGPRNVGDGVDTLQALTSFEPAGGRPTAFLTDVPDVAAVERLAARTIDTFGRLDAAFNNAGGSGHRPTPLADVAVEAFDGSYAATLRGTFLCMKFEIPAML